MLFQLAPPTEAVVVNGVPIPGIGRVYLLTGAIQRGITSAAGCTRAFSGWTGALLFTVPGDSVGDRFDTRVLGLPGVNGDGAPDLAATPSEWPNWQAPSVVLRVVSGAPLVLASDRHSVNAAAALRPPRYLRMRQ